MFFGGVTELPYFCFTPDCLRQISGPILMIGCEDFAITIGRDLPFRTFRFINRGNTCHCTSYRPFILFLQSCLTAIGRLLGFLRIIFRSLGVFLRFLFRNECRPLMTFVGLVGLKRASEGGFHQVFLALLTGLRDNSGLLYFLRASTFKGNGQAFRDSVTSANGPRIEDVMISFLLGRFLTVYALRYPSLRR